MTALPMFATDLDETLIFRRKRPDDTAQLHVVARSGIQGTPDSVMTVQAYQMLGQIARLCHVVPVTARSVDAFRRVQLPFTPAFAVAGNGASILVDGVLDSDWERRIDDQRRGTGGRQVLQTLLDASLAVHQVRTSASGMLVADVTSVDDLGAQLPDIRSAAESWNWYVSVQHGKLHVVPPYLRKASAVREVQRRVHPQLLLAAGDSEMDQGMLAMSAAGWRPAEGELHEQQWQPDHVTAVGGAGPQAGQMILEAVHASVLQVRDAALAKTV